MDSAFHLLGAEARVDRATDVVGDDDPFELALVVEQNDLSGVAERQVSGRIEYGFRGPWPRGEVADILTAVLAADELLKLLALSDPTPTVGLMVERGIFAPVLPEFTAEGVRRLARLVEQERRWQGSD